MTLIDTAPVYGFGRSEEIVGKALTAAGLRDKVRIATKGRAGAEGRRGLSGLPSRIRQAIEDSLRRLRTDVFDLYQVHQSSHVTISQPGRPIEVHGVERGMVSHSA